MAIHSSSDTDDLLTEGGCVRACHDIFIVRFDVLFWRRTKFVGVICAFDRKTAFAKWIAQLPAKIYYLTTFYSIYRGSQHIRKNRNKKTNHILQRQYIQQFIWSNRDNCSNDFAHTYSCDRPICGRSGVLCMFPQWDDTLLLASVIDGNWCKFPFPFEYIYIYIHLQIST